MSHTTRAQRTDRASVRLLAAGALALLAACAGDDAASPANATPDVPGSASQVQEQLGNAAVTAVAIQTSQIPAEVAAARGIERRDDLVMLRVSPRRGEAGELDTAPVQVRATVTDLRGTTRALELHRQDAAGLVDHVGTVPVTLPDTLRFSIEVTNREGQTDTLELTRQFSAG